MWMRQASQKCWTFPLEYSSILKRRSRKAAACRLPATSISISFGVCIEEGSKARMCLDLATAQFSLTSKQARQQSTTEALRKHAAIPWGDQGKSTKENNVWPHLLSFTTPPPLPLPPSCLSLVSLPNNDGYFSGCSPPRCPYLPNGRFS